MQCNAFPSGGHREVRVKRGSKDGPPHMARSSRKRQHGLNDGSPILILTQEFDPIADRLVVELDRRGTGCVRWHPDSLISDAALHVSVDGGDTNASISWRGKVIDIHEIRSVWNRRPAPFRFPKRVSGKNRVFAEQEIKSALAGTL